MNAEETRGAGENPPTREEVAAFVSANRMMRRIFLRTRIDAEVSSEWVPLTREEEQHMLDHYDVELCEGCAALATHHDVENVPLCEECWQEI